MDLAAINVRKLKKERAVLEVVKAAVEEFKAAKAAYEQESTTSTSEPAARVEEPTRLGGAEPTKIEVPPTEEGVMILPVVIETPPVTERKPSGLTVPKSADVNAAADQVRTAKQSGRQGGKGRGKGGNQGGS
jgi:hypothetical protein